MLPPHSSPPPSLFLVINQIWFKITRGGGSRDRGMNEGFKIPEDFVFVRVRGQGARQREVRLVQEFLFVLVNQSSTTTTQ